MYSQSNWLTYLSQCQSNYLLTIRTIEVMKNFIVFKAICKITYLLPNQIGIISFKKTIKKVLFCRRLEKPLKVEQLSEHEN